MTKEQLREYIPLRRECKRMEQRLRIIEQHPDAEKEIVEPLRAFYTEKLKELVQAQLDIEHAIETLGPVERDLVRLRYLDGLSWHKVCAKINYEWTQTHRIHSNALNKLGKL